MSFNYIKHMLNNLAQILMADIVWSASCDSHIQVSVSRAGIHVHCSSLMF